LFLQSSSIAAIAGYIGQKGLKLSVPLCTLCGSPQSNLRLSSAANIVKTLENSNNNLNKVLKQALN